jgi:hypothetical protein
MIGPKVIGMPSDESSGILDWVLPPIIGDKRATSETRHRPEWWPKHFDKRWFGERVAVMDIPPYKPPYRRHIRVKAWVCAGPNYVLHCTIIAELDLDERSLEVNINR